MWVVTEREAAAMYARASLKWYGPRARSVVHSMISKMAKKGDLKGLRAWRLVFEQLAEAEQQQQIFQKHGAPRHKSTLPGLG